jgi:hypothetical protein
MPLGEKTGKTRLKKLSVTSFNMVGGAQKPEKPIHLNLNW